MRIVSGTHKGRVIRPPKFFKARPTTDMAKESLFNILQNRFDFSETEVLDLFSGTGSISYEFASRSCKRIDSVEKDFRYYSFIRDTAKQFGFDNLNCIKGDCFKFLKHSSEKFDIVFADPPYELENLGDLPDLVFQSEILIDEGLFILEHPDKYNFSKHPNFSELRKYSRVNFSFFVF
ncbi:MAG: RsmD family RNA methyltransferase [Bacteroidota bacterium]|nr:RsmD family RNA methyltransferase [Bacteroidota bacterium]